MCSNKINTYPPICAVHNVELMECTGGMVVQEGNNLPGLGHITSYFCPVGQDFVLIADGM
jgi:hypothetical protein